MPRISQLGQHARYGESSHQRKRDSQLLHRHSEQRMELEPTPPPSWDSQPSAAPPGVTPLPPHPAALPPAGLEACEQAALRRAEQVIDGAIERARAERPERLERIARQPASPLQWERRERTGQAPQLTVAEAAQLVRAARNGGTMAGARMVRSMAGSPTDAIPKAPACRTHAARRWTRRVVGRAVGLKQLRPVIEALKPIMAERARRAARRASGA